MVVSGIHLGRWMKPYHSNDDSLRGAVAEHHDATIKLLFVDDDRHVLKSLLRLFDDKDYEVYGVLSGEEGLDILSLHPDIKIVVSDYMMPVMTGVEFLKKAARIAPKCCSNYPHRTRRNQSFGSVVKWRPDSKPPFHTIYASKPL